MDSWPERIATDSATREQSLSELRDILLRGLQAGLSSRASSDTAFLEDVVQMTLLKIIKNLDTFQGRSKFTSWAIAIAFRIAYNELRRKEWSNVSFEALQGEQKAVYDKVDNAPAPDEEVERRSSAYLLKTIIENELTDKQRDVLLCELSGMPQEEIALHLDTNRNNVYKIFHDARKAMKRSLEMHGYDRTFFFGTANKQK